MKVKEYIEILNSNNIEEKLYYGIKIPIESEEEFEDLNWDNISRSVYLSESFIEYYIKYIKLDLILKNIVLSESFIEKYFASKSFYWANLSKYQPLSEEFIEKY